MSYFGPIKITGNSASGVSNYNRLFGCFQIGSSADWENWGCSIKFKTPSIITDTVIIRYDFDDTIHWILGYNTAGYVYLTSTGRYTNSSGSTYYKDGTVTFDSATLSPGTEYNISIYNYNSYGYKTLSINGTKYSKAYNSGRTRINTSGVGSSAGVTIDPSGTVEITGDVEINGACYNSTTATKLVLSQSAWDRSSTSAACATVTGYGGSTYGSSCALVTFSNAHKVTLNYTIESDLTSTYASSDMLNWGYSTSTSGYPRYKYFTKGETPAIPMWPLYNLYKSAAFYVGTSKLGANIAFLGWRYSDSTTTTPKYIVSSSTSDIGINVMSTSDVTLNACKLLLYGYNGSGEIQYRSSVYAYIQARSDVSGSEWTKASDIAADLTVGYNIVSTSHTDWNIISGTTSTGYVQYNIPGLTDSVGTNIKYTKVDYRGISVKGYKTGSYLSITFSPSYAKMPVVSGTLTYNGTVQRPTLTNDPGNNATKSGTYESMNAGSFTMTLTRTDGMYWEGTKSTSTTIAWSIAKKPISLTVISKSYVYDNVNHVITGYDVSITGNFATGDYLSSVKINGQSSLSIINVGEYTCGPSSAIIKNASGVDVSVSYDISYTSGVIKITKKPLVLTWNITKAGTTNVWYDGVNSFTYDGNTIRITGSVTPISGTTCPVIFYLDGSTESKTYIDITDVKCSEGWVTSETTVLPYNIVAALYNSNYSIDSNSTTSRSLTLNKRIISMSSGSATKVYEAGVPLTNNTINIDYGSIAGHTYTGTFSGGLTNVGEINNEFTVACTDSTGKSVTKNYRIYYFPGKLKVTPRVEEIPKLNSFQLGSGVTAYWTVQNVFDRLLYGTFKDKAVLGVPTETIANKYYYMATSEGIFATQSGISVTSENWGDPTGTIYTVVMHLINDNPDPNVYNVCWADGTTEPKSIEFYVLGTTYNWSLCVDGTDITYVPDQSYYGSAVTLNNVVLKNSGTEVVDFSCTYSNNTSTGLATLIVTSPTTSEGTQYKCKWQFYILDGEYNVYYNDNGYNFVSGKTISPVVYKYSDNILSDSVKFKWLNSYGYTSEYRNYNITYDNNLSSSHLTDTRNIKVERTYNVSHTSWQQMADSTVDSEGVYTHIKTPEFSITPSTSTITGLNLGVTSSELNVYLQAASTVGTEDYFNPPTIIIPKVRVSAEKFEEYYTSENAHTITIIDYPVTSEFPTQGGQTYYYVNSGRITDTQPSFTVCDSRRQYSTSYNTVQTPTTSETGAVFNADSSVSIAANPVLQTSEILYAQWSTASEAVLGTYKLYKHYKTDSTYNSSEHTVTVSYQYDPTIEKVYDSSGSEQPSEPASIIVPSKRKIVYSTPTTSEGVEYDFVDQDGNLYTADTVYNNGSEDLNLWLKFKETDSIVNYGPFTISDWYCERKDATVNTGEIVRILWDANGGTITYSEGAAEITVPYIIDTNQQEYNIYYTWSGWKSNDVTVDDSEVYATKDTTLVARFNSTNSATEWPVVSIPKPERTGYIFDGYSGNPELTDAKTDFRPNFNFYAKADWHEQGTIKPTKSNEFFYPYVELYYMADNYVTKNVGLASYTTSEETSESNYLNPTKQFMDDHKHF